MIQIVIEDVLRNVAQSTSAIQSKQVLGITSDSRQVQPGFIFVAIKGVSVDGNQFINDAFDKGAVCVITDANDIEDTDTVIKVSNARKALTQLASNFYGNPEPGKGKPETGNGAKTIDLENQHQSGPPYDPCRFRPDSTGLDEPDRKRHQIYRAWLYSAGSECLEIFC